MKLSTGFLLLVYSCSGLLLAGCASDEEKGLCSYLGGCGESDDDDNEGAGASATGGGRGSSHDHDTTDHGGGHDDSGTH